MYVPLCKHKPNIHIHIHLHLHLHIHTHTHILAHMIIRPHDPTGAAAAARRRAIHQAVDLLLSWGSAPAPAAGPWHARHSQSAIAVTGSVP